MFAGSATVFFAFIGFDSVASAAEEVNLGIYFIVFFFSFFPFQATSTNKGILIRGQVKNPQRDLPIGIGLALFLCCSVYMMVSIVIVGLVPYYAMDPDTPISSAFASHDMQWAV